MNDLLEMLEMKEKLENLIEEVVGDLTVNEFIQLRESGILNESIGKQLGRIIQRVTKTRPSDISKLAKTANNKIDPNVMKLARQNNKTYGPLYATTKDAMLKDPFPHKSGVTANVLRNVKKELKTTPAYKRNKTAAKLFNKSLESPPKWESPKLEFKPLTKDEW